MLITKQSGLTGKQHSMDVDVTDEDIQKWKEGTMIQLAMPNLTPDEREFIMTGITPQEWSGMLEEE